MSSAQDDTVLPTMETFNFGPGLGASAPRHSTTPDASPALSFATAAEYPEDLADLDLDAVSVQLQDVQIEEQTVGPATQAGMQTHEDLA